MKNKQSNKNILKILWLYYRKEKYKSGLKQTDLAKTIGISIGCLNQAINPNIRHAGSRNMIKIRDYVEKNC